MMLRSLVILIVAIGKSTQQPTNSTRYEIICVTLPFYAPFIRLRTVYIRGNYIYYMVVRYAENVSGVKMDVFTSLWRTDVRFGERLADRFRL